MQAAAPFLALSCAAFLALGAPAAPAQVEDGMMPQTPPDKETAPRERIEELFDQLSDPSNPNWEATQSQIFLHWQQSGSDSMDLLLRRALEAVESEQLEVALLHLNDLVRLAPDFAEGWNQRATVHFLRGNYGQAVADIERVLALEPRHFGALAGLGIILDRTGNKEGALRMFRRVLELNPHMEGARDGVERLAPEVDGREL